MALQLVRLAQARTRMAFGLYRFIKEFPGVFFLAVGQLAGKRSVSSLKIEGLTPAATEELDDDGPDETMTMDFGERMTHALYDHPLAGCAFFLPNSDMAAHTVGRKAECDLAVPDPSVSELHCEVRLDEEKRLFVTDLRSTNGTFVNLIRLRPGEPTELKDEAILTVGRYSFQFFSAQSLFRATQILDD